ncbi:hypothetical protein FEM48_Zijuj11G0053100 [Ziziphus jujuba var. spinosa]|uniref:Cytochrome P450 n=1 Tax=Ziziphus jujuba var. spinosa TaxID=714518 RepID=A0A978UH21_ZIZJJ|nr:hypothetical protein FEM48_Zijuj11G0053100 [Ziziphus jujuba var. spinosa]
MSENLYKAPLTQFEITSPQRQINISTRGSAMWSSWWDIAFSMNNKYSAELLTLLLITTSAVLWIFRAAKNPKKASPRLPPGPLGLPLVGYLPFLGSQVHREFSQLAKIYGPIYKFWLGTKLCVVVSSPSLAKEVVRDHDSVFANRDPPISAQFVTFGGNDIVFSPLGKNWRKLRKIFVSQMLGSTVLDNSYSLRREQVMKSIRNVYANIGNPIDVGELAFLTSINSVMSMFWGGTEQEEKGVVFGAEFKNMTTELMVLLGKSNLSDIFPVLARFDIQGIQRQVKKVADSFERVFDSAIDQRKKTMEAEKDDGRPEGNEERKDFMQFLLRLHDGEDRSSSITMPQLKAVLMFDYNGNNFEYLPFGSGRRVCAGIPLGEKMLNFVVASFLHSFEWKMPLGEKLDLSDSFGMVTKKMTPLVAIPTTRLSNLELYA